MIYKMSYLLLSFLLALSVSVGSLGKARASGKSKLGEICEKALSKRLEGSSINRRLYHISQMSSPCRKHFFKDRGQARMGAAVNHHKPYYTSKDINGTYSSWGIDSVYQDSWINILDAWKLFRPKKKEVVVAVVDTGIDFNHTYLNKNIYVVEGVKGKSNYGKDFSIPSSSGFRSKKVSNRAPKDDHGHGTHVAGIIRSVYPGVKILPIKYYNSNRSGQENLKALIDSLEYAIRVGVDIINYSGGGPEPSIEEFKVLNEAKRKGILVIVAAGNEMSNIDQKNNAFYPASYNLNNIVTVTAHNQKSNILSSSNWGKKSVDISAPGWHILSSAPLQRSSYMTGTSQATAFVTGVAALIRAQYPSLKGQRMKDILRQSVKRMASLVEKCNSKGRLDANGALIRSQKREISTLSK